MHGVESWKLSLRDIKQSVKQPVSIYAVVSSLLYVCFPFSDLCRHAVIENASSLVALRLAMAATTMTARSSIPAERSVIKLI